MGWDKRREEILERRREKYRLIKMKEVGFEKRWNIFS